VILRHAWALQNILGPAIATGLSALTLDIILTLGIGVTIIVGLYMIMKTITGKPAFKACRELIS
jgi:hypothetical protein